LRFQQRRGCIGGIGKVKVQMLDLVQSRDKHKEHDQQKRHIDDRCEIGLDADSFVDAMASHWAALAIAAGFGVGPAEAAGAAELYFGRNCPSNSSADEIASIVS